MLIHTLIADDHALIRDGVRQLFDGTEISIVGEASTCQAALLEAERTKPDVVLLDVRMPESKGEVITASGLSTLTRIKQVSEKTSVLMFSAYDNPTYVARAVASGAAGYILKSAPKVQILNAVRAAARGEHIWTREEIRRVSGALSTPRLAGNIEVALTQREHEVVEQLVLGKTNKEIGKTLGISFETVKEHVQHILRKLGVNDRTQAAIWAVRNGVA